MARSKPSKNNPNYLLYLALLVGVISLLGVVFLTLKVASFETEATLAGQAAGGGVQLPANQQCVWKSVEAGAQTTGSKVCAKDNTFKNCYFAQSQRIHTYFTSNDGSCSGQPQLPYDEEGLDENVWFYSCRDRIERPNEEPCHIWNDPRAPGVAEPVAGDYMYGEGITQVLCCK
ncbi:MAG: hypothetical protein QT02_C0004G0059 [archaeon GW2011_AR9]|nr:MAG: hypothetical protein QT02_C0004G0059 [archaeon GW2011_AR9]MBS3120371.1 hypothetical protein [Candidatus Woesearchaeota archaeon]HIG92863.1 hypothetical protein [Candidatus Woesearchaeota archaeon]HIH13162.1 hypothetical protein [Candidatus Woesearchaeota archaeon]